MAGLRGFIHRISDEGHGSERLAGRWHTAHAIAYGALLVLYAGAIVFHVSAARRHFRDAASKSANVGRIP